MDQVPREKRVSTGSSIENKIVIMIYVIMTITKA